MLITMHFPKGSINTAGSAVSWLKDNLNIISSHEELTIEANKVPDSGGMVFVPAFSGLFAPRWRSDARGYVFPFHNRYFSWTTV